MNASIERLRVAGLCACMALFFMRVVAPIQVVLLHPDWLPPIQAWYSGLIPYAALLPVQMLVLLFMALVVSDHARGYGAFWPTRSSTRVALRWVAALYAAAMAVRLMVTAAVTDGGWIDAGIIPVAFHWVLAGFLALIGAAPARYPVRSSAARTNVLTRDKPLPRLPFLNDIASASDSETHEEGDGQGSENSRRDGYSEVPLEDLVRIRRRSL